MRTHPESGRKSIYINPIRIEGIFGLDHKEALPLLDELLEHATQERFQYRHRWQPGDLVMWDNRCLLHKANGDYDMDADALSLPRHAARRRAAGVIKPRVCSPSPLPRGPNRGT